MSRTGYPNIIFDKIIVGTEGQAPPKTFVDGNPFDYPLSRDANAQEIGVADAHNSTLINGIEADTTSQQLQPLDHVRAEKLFSTFWIDPTSPVYKLIAKELKDQEMAQSGDAAGFRGMSVKGVKRGQYATNENNVLPTTVITYELPNGTVFRSEKVFLAMPDILGKAPDGKPAGLWLNTGNIK